PGPAGLAKGRRAVSFVMVDDPGTAGFRPFRNQSAAKRRVQLLAGHSWPRSHLLLARKRQARARGKRRRRRDPWVAMAEERSSESDPTTSRTAQSIKLVSGGKGCREHGLAVGRANAVRQRAPDEGWPQSGSRLQLESHPGCGPGQFEARAASEKIQPGPCDVH